MFETQEAINTLVGTGVEGLDAIDRLGEISNAVEVMGTSKTISSEAYQFVRLNINQIKCQLGFIDSSTTKVTLENRQGETIMKSVAFESIGETMTEIWKRFVKILVAIKNKLMQFFSWVLEAFFGVKKKVEKLQKEKVDDKSAVFTMKGEFYANGDIVLHVDHDAVRSEVNEHVNKQLDGVDAAVRKVQYSRIKHLFAVHAYQSNSSRAMDPSEVEGIVDELNTVMGYFGLLTLDTLEIVKASWVNDENNKFDAKKVLEKLKSLVPHSFTKTANASDGSETFVSHFGSRIEISNNPDSHMPFMVNFLAAPAGKQGFKTDEVRVRLARNADKDRLLAKVTNTLKVVDQLKKLKDSVDTVLSNTIDVIEGEADRVAKHHGQPDHSRTVAESREYQETLTRCSRYVQHLAVQISTNLSKTLTILDEAQDYCAMSVQLSQRQAA